MKIFCCHTKSHERLLTDYFKPSLPPDLELHAIPREGDGTGDFRSDQWIKCLHNKIDMVVGTIRDHCGEIIIWSDIDILFFRPVAKELEALIQASGKEILFQRERNGIPDINGGFYVLRANEKTLAFFEQVRAGLAANPDVDDQFIINTLLRACPNFAWGYLPFSYYARTHGWPPPRDLAIFHANGIMGKNSIELNISQFKEILWIRKYGRLALLLSCVAKIPKRCKRVWAERLSRHACKNAA